MTQFPEEMDRDKEITRDQMYVAVQLDRWRERNPEAAKALVEGKAWVIKSLPDQIGDYFNKVYDRGKIVPNEFLYDGRVARLDRPEGDDK